MNCECKSGFFALRDCGQPALGQCQSCSRAMCHAHASAESRFAECRDCWARRNQATDPDMTDRNRRYDDDWATSYRSRYYAAGYAPIYAGSHYHHYYDRYDTRAFAATDRDIGDDDDVRAGFGDS
jgi:hypothetical protein